MDRPETGHAPGSCCHKTKERAEAERKRLCNRLSRIEGQIRGIRGMVEKDAYDTAEANEIIRRSGSRKGGKPRRCNNMK